MKMKPYEIRQARLQLGMDEYEFAEALGISRDYVYRLEFGRRNASQAMVILIQMLLRSKRMKDARKRKTSTRAEQTT